ncbi:MAG: M24 family metallopeptidase [Myxococcales bacterium]|nr:M24 family metallopeptidase [Myxococcales bacterium]
MDIYAERRRQVLERIEGAAIILSAPATIRNNDVEQPWRQDSDLYYLTGCDEPESVLVLSKTHAEHRAVLFLRPRDPEREVWDGERVGVEAAPARFGVDAAFPITELRKSLPAYLNGASELVYEHGRQHELDTLVDQAVTDVRARGRAVAGWPRTRRHPDGVWHELRLRKSDAELALMRRAAAITTEAHVAAMAAARAGAFEYELEAVLLEAFHRGGAERVAYSPIVGSGPNATVLHYRANRRKLEEGELILIDAGCEYGYYASDVTRTFPVNGRYSVPQRKIYEAVLAAQEAAILATKPGTTIEELHAITVRTLTAGMLDVGLLTGTLEEALEKEEYRRYYMHRTSHWIGMDVHDVGAYFVGGKPRPLEPGMVFTIEPGIYVGANDLRAPPEFRGIGVRIEDDILVTETGHENLTAAIPKSVDEIERACRG